MGETIFKCIYGIRSAQYVHTSWICANRSHRPKIYLLCTHDGWLAPGCDSVQGKDIILNLDTVLEAKPHLFLWKLFSGILSWTSKKLDFPAMKILGSFLLCRVWARLTSGLVTRLYTFYWTKWQKFWLWNKSFLWGLWLLKNCGKKMCPQNHLHHHWIEKISMF